MSIPLEAPEIARAAESDSPFVDTEGAARITHYTVKSLNTKRSRGDGPPFYKAGSKVLYHRDELIQWVLSQRRTSTSDPGRQQQVAAS